MDLNHPASEPSPVVSDARGEQALRHALAAVAKRRPVAGRAPQSGLIPAICELRDPQVRDELLAHAIRDIRLLEPDTARAYAALDFGKALADAAEGAWVVPLLEDLLQCICEAEMPSLAREIEEWIVEAWARAGEYQEALGLARRMATSRSYPFDSLARLVRLLASDGLIAPAFKVLDLIDAEPAQAEALESLAAAVSKAGLGEDTPTWLSRYLDAVKRLQDATARGRVLHALVQSMEPRPDRLRRQIAGELTRVEKAMARARTAGARGAVLRDVVGTWVLLGDIDRALQVLEDADAGELALPAVELLVQGAEMAPSLREGERAARLRHLLTGLGKAAEHLCRNLPT